MRRRFFNVTNLSRLLETQKPDAVHHLGGGVELEWHERLANRLEADTDRIKSAQIIARAIVGPKPAMGKLQEVALRIKAKKQELDGHADEIASRLDQIDVSAPQAFDRAHRLLDQSNADIEAMESELRQLSNLEE